MSAVLGLVGLFAAQAVTPFPVADDVLYRGEALAVPSVAVRSGETLAHAIYRARAGSVVAISASDGQGSGALIRDDGFVLTCAHVVGDDAVVDVVLQGGASYRARVVATEAVADLAILKIEAPDLENAVDTTMPSSFPWMPIGDLDDLDVGDTVVAIGHPKGFGWTLNEGIVSNLFVFRDGQRDPNVIQTQVPLNPGNSGGPLLDKHGHLVGVVSQGDPAAQALNWCISARAVKNFLLRHGNVMPPATLSVDASPAGATVLVDGFEIGNGPHVSTQIEPGAHVIQVKKAGFGEVDAPIVVLQRHAADMKVRLAPAGTLAVTSDTTDVEIYVDGVYRGLAPVSVDVAEGPHTVTGVKDGSVESHASVAVKAEKESEVALSNPARQAFLSVSSAPAGAEVVIDGESAGVTPVAERIVAPGRHVVDVKTDDTSRRVVVDLAADARRELQFNLEPRTNTVASEAAAIPAAAPRIPPPHPRTMLRSGLSISLAGAAVSLASAAVLLTQKDASARTAASATMIAGASGLVVGPALFFHEMHGHDGPGVIRADKNDKAQGGIAAGMSATFRF